MKNLLLLLMIISLLFTLYSCTKNNTETGSLIGNWNVVNDSSLNTNQFFTLIDGDSGIVTGNYNGEQCGATFNFNSNGILRTSFFNCIYGDGPIIDSANYIVKDNQVIISILAQNHSCCSFTYLNPVVARIYTISNLTANTATLTFQSVEVSGMETEIINLKK